MDAALASDPVVSTATVAVDALRDPRDGDVRYNEVRSTRKTKLTEGQVREIRRLHEAGRSRIEIAAPFGVTSANVWNIIIGRAWKHVGPGYGGF